MINEQQKAIIKALGVVPTIDPATEVRKRVQFLCDYVRATHTKGFVLGISGGVDSTTAGKLAQLAASELRSTGYDAQFIAVRLPHGVQADEADATAAVEWINPDRAVTINIEAATTGMAQAYTEGMGTPISDFNKGNVKARMRMIAQFAIAGDEHLVVIGTDHAAENITGFFTKFGDGAADILPLAGLDKRQVRSIAHYLGAPDVLWEKVPTADLLDNNPGRTDEEELGMSYDQIDDYLEGKEVADDVVVNLENRWNRMQHKRFMPVTPNDTWWR